MVAPLARAISRRAQPGCTGHILRTLSHHLLGAVGRYRADVKRSARVAGDLAGVLVVPRDGEDALSSEATSRSIKGAGIKVPHAPSTPEAGPAKRDILL